MDRLFPIAPVALHALTVLFSFHLQPILEKEYFQEIQRGSKKVAFFLIFIVYTFPLAQFFLLWTHYGNVQFIYGNSL